MTSHAQSRTGTSFQALRPQLQQERRVRAVSLGPPMPYRFGRPLTSYGGVRPQGISSVGARFQPSFHAASSLRQTTASLVREIVTLVVTGEANE